MDNALVGIETICEHADGQSFVMIARTNGARYVLRVSTRGIPNHVSSVGGIVQIRHGTASMRKLVVEAPEIGQYMPDIDPVCAAVMARGYPLSCLRFYVRHLYPNPEFIKGVLPNANIEDAIALRLSQSKKHVIADRMPRVTKLVTPTRPVADRPPSWLIAYQAITHEPIAIEIAMPDAYEHPDDFVELIQRIGELPQI